MFTGLIEEIGIIKNIQRTGNGTRISVFAKKILEDIKIDDSIALNGACQTVIDFNETSFDVIAIEETMKKTTLSNWTSGKRINLERAVTLNTRMGGHLVQGHVDCTGLVSEISYLPASRNLWISFPEEYSKYIVKIGSICINGTSLTVANKQIGKLMVSIIPHTWDNTIFNELKLNDKVNLEFDLIAKYVENMFHSQTKSESYFDKFIDQPEY